jgi:exodeoxyribonuclease X
VSGISQIVVVDTETTGFDPDNDAVIEVGAVPVELDLADGSWVITDGGFWSFLEYEGDIPAESRAVHHIHPDQVRPGAANCVPRDVIMGQMIQAEVPGEMVYASHTLFDQKMLRELSLPFIDTCQCARHLLQDAPSYKNQVLRYWLGIEPPEELLAGLEAHRAFYDAACTAALLTHLLTMRTPEELLVLSTEPILLVKCHLKKYKDQPWADVPRDYLAWITRTDMLDDNPNLKHTVNYYLNGGAAGL